MSTELFTIGYEGSTVEDLVSTLIALNVEVLADVRELPLSRKKGLSKNKLAERLAEVGIEYRHYKALGDPKPGREAAKKGDFQQFEKIYLNHLGTQEAQEELKKLLKVANARKTCMMCFERSATHCHRSYIADEASRNGFEVYNLVADRAEQYLQNGNTIPRYNPRKSISTAK
ncbi:DUF488 domain-containing protein [Epibacterium ulvae]|uniref:DUF488 domain-containing protein n=1 Tax=Epibacterium ulvae TaxID=1156985 RepID=UPI001BFC1E4D|nr:DUF488 domain-containing protein [Epibacterium ulvae]MBT8152626.1 DUF488 domain-containing protein [Epibacterium ulvae]